MSIDLKPPVASDDLVDRIHDRVFGPNPTLVLPAAK
jgi:hypothetical protein